MARGIAFCRKRLVRPLAGVRGLQEEGDGVDLVMSEHSDHDK
jgi:hypothetical protein